jgi:hypothetical protein
MYEIDEEILDHTRITPTHVHSYIDKISLTKQSIMKITGFDPKYIYKGEFLKVFKSPFRPDFWETEYDLDNGFIYKYKNLYVQNGHYTNGFFLITEEGKLMSIEEGEVKRLLNIDKAKWKKTEFTTEEIKKQYAEDDVPF